MKQLAAALVVLMQLVLLAFAVNGLLSGLWGLPADPLFANLPAVLKPADSGGQRAGFRVESADEGTRELADATGVSETEDGPGIRAARPGLA